MEEITVSQLADLLRAANKGGHKASLLIGAGVSKTAGIGLADDFVARIKQDFPAIYEAIRVALVGDGDPGYAQCMAALPPAMQVQLVREDIDNARINWAHIGIARLESEEFIDSILTPNFDPLASRACALFHRFPAIYDLAGLRDHTADHIDFDKSYVKGSAIFHLHGQHTGFILLITEEKLLSQAKRIRPVLDASMKGKPVIIVGYSGDNDPLVDEIADLAPFNHGLFWVRHDAADPAANVCNKLLSQDNCFLIRDMPSDKFFTDLANALGLAPPKFMFSPFEHMLGVLETIECYAKDGGSPQDSLLVQAKSQLKKAFENSSRSKMAELMSAGKYDEVLAGFGDKISELDKWHKRQFSWAAAEVAVKYSNLGRAGEGQNAEKMFTIADGMFRAAYEVTPRMFEVIWNWAVMLINWSYLKDGEEKRDILKKAREKSFEANRLRPGHSAYNLACISAINNKIPAAIRYLRQSARMGLFPGCDHIAADRDFDGIRNSREFREVMVEIGCPIPALAQSKEERKVSPKRLSLPGGRKRDTAKNVGRDLGGAKRGPSIKAAKVADKDSNPT